MQLSWNQFSEFRLSSFSLKCHFPYRFRSRCKMNQIKFRMFAECACQIDMYLFDFVWIINQLARLLFSRRFFIYKKPIKWSCQIYFAVSFFQSFTFPFPRLLLVHFLVYFLAFFFTEIQKKGNEWKTSSRIACWTISMVEPHSQRPFMIVFHQSSAVVHHFHTA